ncbi:NAD(P)-binding protein [Aspergillus costaricaensis CBS 115574]|uniref:NAD(P)-binding protein n=1 Tax=Aspergillus costaricaensis CBS 115574 TaxID=1448317 RepID=A0ACD1IUS3_9EURO|nr:NAD(P)-binding protein [Aspergillus costaricaensis CBS 115574]RAK93816.1 NAD(P)-binding protein [Aspergillus costaricaensis CBS 115574]
MNNPTSADPTPNTSRRNQTTANTAKTFPLFPFLPAELRHQIWQSALPEPTHPPSALLPHRKGCWVTKPIPYTGEPGQINDPNGNYEIVFDMSLLDHVQIHTPLLHVNSESRAIAQKWAQRISAPRTNRLNEQQQIQAQTYNDNNSSEYIPPFSRPFDIDSDWLYLVPDNIVDLILGAGDRLEQPDMNGKAARVVFSLPLVVVSEEVIWLEDEALVEEIMELFSIMGPVFILVGEQPKWKEGGVQRWWDVELVSRRAFVWQWMESRFVETVEERFGSDEVHERIVQWCEWMGRVLTKINRTRFEMGVARAIRRKKMSQILITGGTGFLASTLIDILLSRGHNIITTVRSAEKASQVQSIRPDIPPHRLIIKIVPDISLLSAFDSAVVNDPPLTGVIHTASPFHYSIDNIKKDMLDPAVNGTIGILSSVQKYAPTVKKVVITSSFAAMWNPNKPAGSKYSEKDWNTVTWEEAVSPANAQGQAGYRTSKALAEREAWGFMEREKPSFGLTVMNPSLIFGPVVPGSLRNLGEVNTSNTRIRDFVAGKFKERCPATGSAFWVDVRDAAMAHAVALEKGEVTDGKRYFLTAGGFCNREIVEVLGEEFPEIKEGLPVGEEALRDGEYPEGGPKYGFDNSASVGDLGLVYRGLRESVRDTVVSLRGVPE